MRWAFGVDLETTLGWAPDRYDAHKEFAEHLLRSTIRGEG